MSIKHIANEKEFEELVLHADKPVLVDFWADWCGPCRMLAPVLEQLDAQYGDKAIIAKVNVDECKQLAMDYQVMSIPAIFLFKDGKVVDQSVGVQPMSSLASMIESA